ncbi:hypothetical protein H3N56_11120 [Cetobacterium sp. 2A]|uniref:hypothetical protein n=1 Tax=Cetobacterium sp. 2A TaxID=2754723 RepID=UPI00163C814F|nr:hypothetical protein [Cetobacterium sp. 2A]MBC2856983.1 hypothetical protein [Cetobacterium sp. 2A]
MEIKENEKILTIKDWLKIQLIMMIPIVNLIMWIKWLVSDKTNINLKNFLIASLIMMVIGGIVVGVIWFFVLARILATSGAY